MIKIEYDNDKFKMNTNSNIIEIMSCFSALLDAIEKDYVLKFAFEMAKIIGRTEMQRTILITEVEDQEGNPSLIFGKFDPITLYRQGYKIKDTYKQLYVMDDKTFAKYGTKKGGRL